MLTFIRWLSHLPLSTLHALGTVIGWLGYALSPGYRQRLRHNAALAQLPPAQRRASVAEAGRLVAELPWLWLRPGASPISKHSTWQGAELIDEALAAGRGLVLLTPHMGSFEVCAQAYAERWGQQVPLTALYRPAHKPWLRELEETARTRPGLVTVPTSLAGVRQMMRALRRGETAGLLPDQVPPEGMGVWAPFFGERAYTMTLAARLVQQTGAAWLLMWAQRLPKGQGFVLRVSAPAQALPMEDAASQAVQAESARIMNQEMERLIRQCPPQYLWGYNRYKAPRAVSALPGGGGQ
jgi:KDO2-lipid IV(A) lauroyltransferase